MNGIELIAKNTSRIITLTEAEQQRFFSILESKKVKKKQLIHSDGEICNHINFVVKGCFRLYNTDEKGVEHVVQFASEDWWIGDVASFITQSPGVFNIESLESSEVLRISKSNIDKLYVDIPKFERYFRVLAENTYIGYQRRTHYNIGSSATDRYLHFKKTYPGFIKRVPQSQVASYLGVTPEFLSKLKKSLGE